MWCLIQSQMWIFWVADDFSPWMTPVGPCSLIIYFYHLIRSYNHLCLAGRRENRGQRRPLMSLKFWPQVMQINFAQNPLRRTSIWLYPGTGIIWEMLPLLDSHLPETNRYSGRQYTFWRQLLTWSMMFSNYCWFFLILFFERERERERENERTRAGKGKKDREDFQQSPCPVWGWCWASFHNCEIMTWAKIKSQFLTHWTTRRPISGSF